jgi:hypothetical protein
MKKYPILSVVVVILFGFGGFSTFSPINDAKAAEVYTAPMYEYVEPRQSSGPSVTIGVKTLRLSDASFVHNTHPDDYFLPGAGTKGSAGKTSVDGQQFYASLGMRYSQETAITNLLWRAELGFLVGGARDRHQNDNDSRLPDNGSFVYTDATPGFYGSVGMVYKFNDFLYAGADIEYNGILVDSGWDRWSHDESQRDALHSYVSIGPVIGCKLHKYIALESTVQFCIDSPSPIMGLKLVFGF